MREITQVKLLSALLIIMIGFAVPRLYKDWQEYKRIRWHYSPVCQINIHLANTKAFREALAQKYDTWKARAKEFGGRLKYLNAVAGTGLEDPAFVEAETIKLYYEQFAFFEQWMVFDTTLFPDLLDLEFHMDYYRNIKPRWT